MLELLSITSNDIRRLNMGIDDAVKRSFDCIISLIGLILLSPLLGLIALAIRRDSPGPVFFHGSRIGRNGKIFKILKFRTMYEDPESYRGPKVTSHDDNRITKLGHWLRDIKLNELPQLYNVVIGDMSLVGPRPEDPDIAATWPADMKKEILSVRPGITSPASVVYRNEELLLSSKTIFNTYFHELGPDKMRMDQLYVRHRSFWLDMDTIFWTFLLLLPKIGANTPPEEFLFVGPFTRLVRQHFHWFSIDLLVTFAALGTAGVAWRVFGPLDVGWPKAILTALGFSLVFSVCGAILGINRISWAKATMADGYDLLPAWVLASILTYTVNEISAIFPSKVILVAFGMSLMGYVAVRFRSRLVGAFVNRFIHLSSGGQSGRERVLIIGGEVTAQHALWLLSHPVNAMRYWVVGCVDNDLFKQGTRIYGVNVVGMVKDVPELMEKYDVGIVILADHYSKVNGYRMITDACNKRKSKFLVLPDFISVFSSMPIGPTVIPVTASRTESKENEMQMPCLQCMSRFGNEGAGVPENRGG